MNFSFTVSLSLVDFFFLTDISLVDKLNSLFWLPMYYFVEMLNFE